MTWVRMSFISDIAFTPLRLNYFRKHDAAVRETTSHRTLFDEKWRVQRFILRSGIVAASVRRKLARQIMKEWIARVRMVPPPKRGREMIQGMTLFGSVFVHAPATAFLEALAGAWQIFHKKMSKHASSRAFIIFQFCWSAGIVCSHKIKLVLADLI
jgi:hypothetical protein